jgi:hypothetical protein
MIAFRDCVAAREQLAWLDDESVAYAVEIAQRFLECEEKVVGGALVWLELIPGGLRGNSHEAAARAVFYLARHGNAHGLPSPD